MTVDPDSRYRPSERGNVFFIIMIGIVMFAALMFTFSRGGRQGTESLGNREAELAASEILSYAQKVQRGVERIKARNISEEDISFENDVDTVYTNPNCTNNTCLVFHPEGGAVRRQNPPAGINNGEPYFFAPNRVGSFDNTTKQIGTDERDLVIILPVQEVVCDSINAMTSKITAWESNGQHNSTVPFIGDYEAYPGTVISNGNSTNQPVTGCFCHGTAPCDSSDELYFYSVILTR